MWTVIKARPWWPAIWLIHVIRLILLKTGKDEHSAMHYSKYSENKKNTDLLTTIVDSLQPTIKLVEQHNLCSCGLQKELIYLLRVEQGLKCIWTLATSAKRARLLQYFLKSKPALQMWELECSLYFNALFHNKAQYLKNLILLNGSWKSAVLAARNISKDTSSVMYMPSTCTLASTSRDNAILMALISLHWKLIYLRTRLSCETPWAKAQVVRSITRLEHH